MPPKNVPDTMVSSETSGVSEVPRISETLDNPRSYEMEALPLKTLDIGFPGTGVHVSANAYGNILQINGTHDTHGVITATAFESFNENLQNSNEVRKFRAKLLGPELLKNRFAGFGVILEGLVPEGKVTLEHIPTKITEPQWKAAQTVYHCKGGITVINTIAVTVEGEVRQVRHLTTTEIPSTIHWKLELGMEAAGPNQCQISRATYGQLTEGGVKPIPKVRSVLKAGPTNINAFQLGSIELADNKDFATLSGIVEIDPQPQPGEMNSALLTVEHPVTITTRFWLNQRNNYQFPELSSLPDSKKWTKLVTSKGPPYPLNRKDYIVRRNVDYVLDNCCIRVDPTNQAVKPVCVITDHVALPLGWNRDNYWQLRPLMQLRGTKAVDLPKTWTSGPTGWYNPEAYQSRIDDALFGHLNWVFRQAQLHATKFDEDVEFYEKVKGFSHRSPKKATRDRHGFWARSYIITGKTKDSNSIFQLDQQCYPFLELCDFWKTYESLSTSTQGAQRENAEKLVRELMAEDRFSAILKLLISEIQPNNDRDGELGLIHTDETPGDDPPTYGNLFSCNLLVWYTFKRLDQLMSHPKFFGHTGALRAGLNLGQRADDLRRAMLKHYTYKIHVGGAEKTVFAYDCGYAPVSTEFRQEMRADGNDVPTLMAEVWGFVDADSNHEHVSTWHNTMEWAFDPECNTAVDETIKVDGEFQKNTDKLTFWVGTGGQVSGLGSVHSPNPWPLGIYQEWQYFTMCGNKAKADDAWNRIKMVQQWDGTFSETVNMKTAECESKAWFNWPGAMIAGAIIDESIGTGPLARHNIKIAATKEGTASAEAPKSTK